jgi:hypothetical protein
MCDQTVNLQTRAKNYDNFERTPIMQDPTSSS